MISVRFFLKLKVAHYPTSENQCPLQQFDSQSNNQASNLITKRPKPCCLCAVILVSSSSVVL